MTSPRIFADFRNADPDGRVRLGRVGTLQDLARLGITLRDGMAVVLYEETLEADGVVQFRPDGQRWVAAIDWNAIRDTAAPLPEPALRLPTGEELTVSQVQELVADYRRDNPAVFDPYDLSKPQTHDEVLPIDILAVNALNGYTRSRPPMDPMTEAWLHRDAIAAAAARITRRELKTLSADERDEAAAAVGEALQQVEACAYIGPVAATKLLHRLRPSVTPIWDRRVRTVYPSVASAGWPVRIRRVYADVLSEPNRTCLEWVRAELPGFPSTLRVWDIVLWQHYGATPPAIDDEQVVSGSAA